MAPSVTIPQAGQGRNQGLITALSLSIISGQNLQLEGLVNDNPRSKPGLGPGGYTAAMAAAEICRGETNAEPGATRLEFKPGDVVSGDYTFDVAQLRPNAAPVSMVLLPLVLPLASADEPSSVFINGGTHVLGGMTSDVLTHIMAPNWRSLGLDLRYTEISPGFFPEGNGEAELSVEPCQTIKPLVSQEPFRPLRLGVQILTSGLPVHLAEQAQEGAKDRLKLHGLTAETRIRRARGGVGMSLLVWAQGQDLRVGFTALGYKGGRPEALANSAVEAMVEFIKSGAAVPAQIAAQLSTTLACAQGLSRFTVDKKTPALKAAIQTIEALQPGCTKMHQLRPSSPIEVRIDGFGLH